MVFVTVGNSLQGFDRLLKGVDRLAALSVLKGDEILVQSGNNAGFRSVHGKQVDFLAMEQFVDAVQRADLVICHAGAGTLFHVFQCGKIPVVMPRRKCYREHVDDHQLELAEVLAAEGRIVIAYEPEDLPNAVAEARRRRAERIPSSNPRMISLVAQAIEELLKQKKKSSLQ